MKRPPPSRRADAPVFVVGCPRSGTTLLYHMLLSSGGFAIYRTESHVFDVLAPYFGEPKTQRDWVGVMSVWRKSLFCERAGVDPDRLTERVVREARNWGDFLRIVMEEIAQDQGAWRWADCTPQHVLHLEEIARTIPDARIIHIIRDGRDVAVSMARLGWHRPLPIVGGSSLEGAACYWAWAVERGREAGSRLVGRYMEVRFEDLVLHPEDTLVGIGAFVDHELDWLRIQAQGIGSVLRPNSAFESKEEGFNPIGRWQSLDQGALERMHRLIGSFLATVNYVEEAEAPQLHPKTLRRRLYDAFYGLKQWARHRTPLGRLFVRPVFGEKTGRINLLTGER